MIRKTLLALLLLATVAGAWAQDERPYKPLIREGCHWFYRYFFTDAPEYDPELEDWFYPQTDEFYELYFDGDTVISGIKYNKLYARYQFRHHPEVLKVAAYMREENKQVFAVNPAEPVLDMVTWKLSQFEGPYFEQTGEYIVFDFGDPEGLARKAYNMSAGQASPIYITEDMTFKGEKRMKIIEGNISGYDPSNPHFQGSLNYIIEGIGYYSGFRTNTFLKPAFVHAAPRSLDNYTLNLSHIVDENGEIEYSLWLEHCNGDYEGLTWDEYEALPGCYSYVAYEEYIRKKGTSSVSSVRSNAADVSISASDGELLVIRKDCMPQGSLTVYNIDGVAVRTRAVTACVTAIPIGDLSPGVYIAQYTDLTGRLNKKFKVK